MPRAAQVEGVEQLGRVDAADGVACGEMNGQWLGSCGEANGEMNGQWIGSCGEANGEMNGQCLHR